MKDEVKGLKEAMEAQARLQAQLKDAKDAFAKDNAALIGAVSAAGAVVDEFKKAIIPMAVDAYELTGEKTLYGGIGIQQPKTRDVVTITDQGAALAFAKEKDMFLMLDEGALLAAAKGMDFPFITKKQVVPPVKVTFPKKVVIDE